MSPDDKRHGTVAGYRAHQKAGDPACPSCRSAKAAYSRRRTVRTQKTAFIDSGYDPADALTGGRWMWDDRRAIRVWVETDERPPKTEDVRNRSCHDCGVTVGPRFRYCEPCGKERDRVSKRAHMRAVRAA